MKMNALQHGCDAAPENEAAVMRALGEDPQQYAALQSELATSYGPGDALWNQQLADLGKLYWRRNRIERMETGLMRDALEEVEERRRSLARDLADVTFEPSQCQAVALGLPQPANPLVRLRLLISLWGVIREQVRERLFATSQAKAVESYYEGHLGWRPRQIGQLLEVFQVWARLGQEDDQPRLDKFVKDAFGDEAGLEARCKELEGLLDDQIAAEEAAFAEEMQAQERKDAIARDACLAPEGKTWEMLLRQEAGLDRAIDRKVRILLTMRKEHAREGRGGSRTAPTLPEAGPPADGSPEAGADTPSSVCEPGQDGQTRGSLRETQTPNGRDLCQPGNHGTESPADENAGGTPKSAEQSQNVIENKGPADCPDPISKGRG
jgi:hypothetical protein